jgi:hypothetical protein
MKPPIISGCLLEDIRRSLALLENHPISRPLTETEAGGYNHN